MAKQESKSGRTTANEPIEAIDPGGTRPTTGRSGKPATKTNQQVVSGDRNDGISSAVGPTKAKPD